MRLHDCTESGYLQHAATEAFWRTFLSQTSIALCQLACLGLGRHRRLHPMLATNLIVSFVRAGLGGGYSGWRCLGRLG